MIKTPWNSLTQDTALNAVESVIKQPLTNRCILRNSYINRVYEMETLSNEQLIIKFYRPQRWSKDMILEEHDFLNKCYALDIPVIPPISYKNHTLFIYDQIPFAIFPKKWGRAIDELTEDLWKETGRLLSRVHNVGETLLDTKRIEWIPSIATHSHLQTLLNSHVIPLEYQTRVNTAIHHFIQQSNPLFLEKNSVLIHGDCHFGNIIYRPNESIYLVDFDDSVMGSPIQDIWMLLPDSPEKCQKELNWFKEGYEVFRCFPQDSLLLIPALQIMRQIHFAAWCAVQHHDPHFKHHFPEWGHIKYWNILVKDIMEFHHDKRSFSGN